MTEADLLTLLDREAQSLSDENNHFAAVLMREAARRLRGVRSCPLAAEPVPLTGAKGSAGQVIRHIPS